MRLLPNSFDFPLLPDVLGDDIQVTLPLILQPKCRNIHASQDGMQLADVHAFMTGVFASAGAHSRSATAIRL
jgi:hypothetical protein